MGGAAQAHLDANDAIAAARGTTIQICRDALAGTTGRVLLLHELGHVLQQTQHGLPAASVADAENDAEAFAYAAARGAPANVRVSRPRGWAFKRRRSRKKLPADHRIIHATLEGRRARLTVRRPDGSTYTITYRAKHNLPKVDATYTVEGGKIVKGGKIRREHRVSWSTRGAPTFTEANWLPEVPLVVTARGRRSSTSGRSGAGRGRRKDKGGRSKQHHGSQDGQRGSMAEGSAPSDSSGQSGAAGSGAPVVTVADAAQIEILKRKGLLPVETADALEKKVEAGERLTFEEALSLIEALNAFTAGGTGAKEGQESSQSWLTWARFLREHQDEISGQVREGAGDLTVEDVEETIQKYKEFVGVSEGKTPTARDTFAEWQRDPELRKAWNELPKWQRDLWGAYADKYGNTTDISRPDPADLEVTRSVRLSMALRMAPHYADEARRDALRAILNDPSFQASIVVGITTYLALWMLPEPVFSKAAAVLTTLALLSLVSFTASEIIALARAWMSLERAAGRARSLPELEAAAEQFAHAMGAQQVRILLALFTHLLGKAVPKPKPFQPPRGGGMVGAGAGGGQVVAATSAGVQVKVQPDGTVVLVGPPLTLTASAMQGSGGAPSGGGGAASGGGSPGGTGGSPRPRRRKVPPPPTRPKDAPEGAAPVQKRTGAAGRQRKKASKPETPQELEARELGTLQPSSPRVYRHASGNDGNMRKFVAELSKHVTSLRGAGHKRDYPKVNKAVLKMTRREVIASRPNLKEAWDRRVTRLYERLDEVFRLQRAAAGDKVRMRELTRRQHAIEKQIDALDKWGEGTVGRLKPDLIEADLLGKRFYVTDITQRPFDPPHNFKTRVYKAVLEALYGWEVEAVDFKSPIVQRPL